MHSAAPICWAISTVVHLSLVFGVISNAATAPASGSPDAIAEDDQQEPTVSATTDQEPRFIAVPERAAMASIPELEPTDLPPLPPIDPSDPLGDLVADLPIGDPADHTSEEISVTPPPASTAEPLLPRLVDQSASAAKREEVDLTKRYGEFAAQISNRLMYQYRTRWRNRFRGLLSGDEFVMRLHIAKSSVIKAELLPGESSGDPAFDALVLEYLNRPAREGRPLNALAVPDRVLTTPVRFR